MSEIKIKCGEGTKEEQKRWFANDIEQPYTKDKKINDKFIKIYGKESHPSFQKKFEIVNKIREGEKMQEMRNRQNFTKKYF